MELLRETNSKELVVELWNPISRRAFHKIAFHKIEYHILGACLKP